MSELTDRPAPPAPAQQLFQTLDLSVLLGPKDELWVSATSESAAVHGVRPRGDGVPTYTALQTMAADFHDGIRRAAPQDGAAWGRELCALLFGEPELLALFHQTRGVAASQGRQLLVRLLAAPGELAAVPWELVLDPDNPERHLTRNASSHLVRAPRSRTYPVRGGILTPPLNLLIILSSPVLSGEDAVFDLFEEKRNLQTELAPLVDSGLLNVDVEEHPTVENLRRRIASRRDGYHLVHYVGHAVPCSLILEDRFGRGLRTDAAAVTELLRICPNLRLVLFAGCETARIADLGADGGTEPAPDWRANLSTADYCARDACSVVIGMQAVLPLRSEWIFTRSFYQAVTSGYSVAEAVRLARAAIAGDEYVGGEKLDWAVPSIIVAGDTPGVLVDASAPLRSVPRKRPAELKLDIKESERDFFARLIPLRLAVDVLTAATTDRVLVIEGPAGIGKSQFVDRALTDIADRVDFVLYAQAQRLNVEDPVGRLCRWVSELLSQRDGRIREPAPGWTSLDWWDRLVQELPDRRFVIAIDDMERLEQNDDLMRATAMIGDRRSLSRLALVGTSLPDWLLNASALAQVARIRLSPFTWDEVWRWTRRNLPPLNRFTSSELAAHYPRLGSQLEYWRRLSQVADRAPVTTPVAKMVDQVAPPVPVVEPGPQPALPDLPRGQRPLRVMASSPLIRKADIAGALTKWAADFQVGGRALTRGQAMSSGLAVLLPVSPQLDQPPALGEDTIVRWVDEAMAARADILLLSVGGPGDRPEQLDRIKKAESAMLIIASAGDKGGAVFYPARYDEVLSVGALSGGAIAPYSAREPEVAQPDLYAPETLAGTGFDELVEGEVRNTAVASVLVAGAAVLVWATYPAKGSTWVRQVLMETATPLPDAGPNGFPRALNIPAALAMAREELVFDSLGGARRSLLELLAGSGLLGADTDTALERLVASGRVVKVVTDTAEFYEAVTAQG